MTDRLKGKVAVVTGAAPRGEGVGNGMATAIEPTAASSNVLTKSNVLRFMEWLPVLEDY